MTIDHIVEADHVIIEPLNDPLEDPTWMRAGSNDLLAYATPIIGPTAALIVHRFGWYFEAGHRWHHFELDELAATFGVGHVGHGRNAPVTRSLARIARFGFGQLSPVGPKLLIRPAIPPLSRRLARTIPAYLADTCPYIVR